MLVYHGMTTYTAAVRPFAIATALAILLLFVAFPARPSAAEAAGAAPTEARADSVRKRFLPLMSDLATKRGIQLPLPLGAGLVYYHLDRGIAIHDVRVGKDGADPQSVSQFAQLSARSRVDNVNLKLDAWILPFLNVYAIAGYIWNTSETTIQVNLPPLLPGGSERKRTMTVPTSLEGTVGGLGLTLAGGYGPFFMIFDANFDQADLGFDDRFKAVVTSIRGGWNGKLATRPFRAWANATDWNTEATATGTVADPDGGTLAFEVDQGPAYSFTYGVGSQYAATRHIELAADTGVDGHGGWYVALVPVYRF